MTSLMRPTFCTPFAHRVANCCSCRVPRSGLGTQTCSGVQSRRSGLWHRVECCRSSKTTPRCRPGVKLAKISTNIRWDGVSAAEFDTAGVCVKACTYHHLKRMPVSELLKIFRDSRVAVQRIGPSSMCDQNYSFEIRKCAISDFGHRQPCQELVQHVVRRYRRAGLRCGGFLLRRRVKSYHPVKSQINSAGATTRR